MTISIDYEEIDFEMRNLIKELNSANLTTKYCCFGHGDKAKLYIMFDENISKKELLEWYKELTRFNIDYNGRLLLNYSVRWNEMYNDPKFIGNWVLSFEGSTSERERVTYAMLWRTTSYIFERIFGERIREVLSYSHTELFEHNKGKLPLYSLRQLQEIVTEGDILINIHEWADVNSRFDTSKHLSNEAIFPVFKDTEPYILIDGSYAPVRKLNSDNYIVAPKLRDFDKEFSERAETRKRIDKIDKEIQTLNRERTALFNKL